MLGGIIGKVAGGGGGGGFGGFLSTIGKLFGFGGGAAAGASGGVGSAGVSDMFGGFLAGGGNMSPGSWYVAGEKGQPEIVKGPGTVVPLNKLGGGDSDNRQVHITNNFNIKESKDLFRRSESQNQINTLLHRSVAMGFSRS